MAETVGLAVGIMDDTCLVNNIKLLIIIIIT